MLRVARQKEGAWLSEATSITVPALYFSHGMEGSHFLVSGLRRDWNACWKERTRRQVRKERGSESPT